MIDWISFSRAMIFLAVFEKSEFSTIKHLDCSTAMFERRTEQ